MRRLPIPSIALATLVIVCILAAGVNTVPSAAQNATPVPLATPAASPVTGGVPCTNLFGIVAGNACLLALNGSHDAGPLDVYADGVLLATGETFGTLGDFVPIAAGQRRFQFVPSGAPLENAVIDTRADLREGVAYELAALGPIARVRSQLLPVDTRPLRQDGARLRVVHGSDDAPAIDLAITGGVPIVANLRPGAISNAIDLPSGTYALEVRRAGTSNIILPLPGTALNPNTSYSFYVIGSLAQGSLGVILVPVLIPPEAAASATPVS
jgi:hypothetical protein